MANNRLQAKDLITIGIFSAIYFVLNFAVMLLSGLHPLIWILLPAILAVITGIPFMLMTTKVQKAGAVVIMGVITALIYFATGQFTLVLLITFALSCILAEIVRYCTHYNSFKGNALSFAFFSLGMCGSPLPLWLFTDDFCAQMLSQGISESYVTAVQTLTSPLMLVIFVVAPFVLAFLGAFIAKIFFKKHFEKAGIV